MIPFQMVGNSSIRISWGRSSANRNVAALSALAPAAFGQASPYGRYGDAGALAAAYGAFSSGGPGVIDPCVPLPSALEYFSTAI